MKYNYVVLSVLFFLSPLYAVWQKKPNMILKHLGKLALNNKDNIWATAPGNVYKWEHNAWKIKGDKLSPIMLSIATDNTAYGIILGEKSRILRFDGKSWKPVHIFKERIEDLVVVNADDIWITKRAARPSGYSAFHWDGKQWEQRGTEDISHIQVGRDGTVMALYWEEQNKKAEDALRMPRMFLVRWDGSKWQKVYTFDEGELISHLAVIDKDTIWGVKGDKPAATYLYLWNPKSKKWIKKGTMEGYDLAAGKDGTLLMTGAHDTIYQWVEKQGVVKKLPPVATSPKPAK